MIDTHMVRLIGKICPTSKYNARAGFSLVEILVAMTILSVGLLGMTLLIVGVSRVNSVSDNLTTAATLALDKMENIQGLGYANAVSATENYNTITKFGSFKRVTNVINDSPSPGMKNITVKVYWGSDKHLVTLSTILAQ